ncbi:GGDEF domain-containing protein [Rhodoferax koreense]|uniref:GGDEF domain-containing protein n=1 Tax=Rhodoferax koreensis TaxID=1842727 RepID=A0A1P8K2I5_9BURK|nr:EAL domain-containing protein [Rhodoferax koreense]APW40206.1 GGDEF domain-containing protein [Rhodoferax koreense]
MAEWGEVPRLAPDQAAPPNGSRDAMLRLIADAVPALMAYYDLPSLRCAFANRRYAEDYGWTPDAILGQTLRQAVGDAAWDVIEPHIRRARSGEPVHYTREQRLPSGALRVIEVNLIPHFSSDEAAPRRQIGIFVLINDVSHHVEAEGALRDSEERLRKFAEVTNEGIVFHLKGIITDVNPALLAMTGYALADLLGRHAMDFVPDSWRQVSIDYLAAAREDPYETALIHKDGHEIPVEMIGKSMSLRGEVHRIVVVRDITTRKEAQRRIEFLALHDPLTQLPNRIYLKERLAQVLALARRRDGLAAVLFIDLDNFKTVNDSLGHHAGDLLLREMARRLSAAVREADMVSRLGGDEFLVVLADIGSREDAAGVADKLLAIVNEAVEIEGHLLSVSPSIGIGLFPDDGDNADDLIRHADAAMYHAKDSGRGHYQFFTPDMSQRAFDALHMESQLREAIAGEQFVLHYQPQLSLADGRLVGLEALVRWQHPQRGLIGPDAFVPFAEARGLIAGIGRWVLCEACRQLKAWFGAGWPMVPVAVNLSAIEFRQPSLVQDITEILAAAGLAPQYLEIELTESVLMDPGGFALGTLSKLKALGVGLAIDDFGTGYSSLAYLKRYPIDKLKIDRSFVCDIPGDGDDVAITTAIVQMAHSLKLLTVAEGVETPEQRALLQSLGCDEYQGYLIARPMDTAALQAWMAQRSDNAVQPSSNSPSP